mgnify:CR=1 FL=1
MAKLCQASNKHRNMNIFSYKKIHTARGVTLLELLIYVAVFSGIAVVVADTFLSIAKARGQSEARAEVNSAIRFATELVRQDLKAATALATPALGTPSATLVATVAGATVTYDVVSGQLRRNAVAVTGSLIFVDTPSFTRLENYNSVVGVTGFGATTTAVSVLMTFRYNASSTDWTYADTLRTTVTLR